MTLRRPLTDDELADIQRAARANDRSVLRRIAGLPVRGRVREDIDRELEARGITGPSEAPSAQ